jgi:sugar lactone lactonase YvrE
MESHLTARTFRHSTVLLISLALAGCSGAGSTATKALPDSPAGLARRQSVDTSAAKTPNLYVANDSRPPSVTVYAPESSSPLRTLTVKEPPVAMALDLEDDLFVAYFRSKLTGSITGVAKYLPKQTAPALQIVDGLGYKPLSLAFDANDDLYVGSENGFRDRVTVYAPGGTSQVRRISHGVWNPDALAFDGDGSLYVANHSNTIAVDDVTVYRPGKSEYFRTISSGVYRPAALAFDRSGNLFVANQRLRPGSPDSVSVYAPGNDQVVRTIVVGINANPDALAFDSSGNLYVLCPGLDVVKVYGPASTSLLRLVNEGVDKPAAMALSSSGELYVANKGSNSITIYAAGSGKVLRKVSTGVSKPVALLFGP